MRGTARRRIGAVRRRTVRASARSPSPDLVHTAAEVISGPVKRALFASSICLKSHGTCEVGRAPAQIVLRRQNTRPLPQ